MEQRYWAQALLYRSHLLSIQDGETPWRCSRAGPAARLPRSPSGHGAGGECYHGKRLKLLDNGTRDGCPPDGKQRFSSSLSHAQHLELGDQQSRRSLLWLMKKNSGFQLRNSGGLTN
ncbi:hypothetical protein BDA96_02G072700 [Sorghum bicolor]|uniref:Uncharacterized protein n=2 Tax=Sorghum bicolor TaxID=4558 RepID=A0A921URX4_SORBI|nr:uncharacterized protein LOC110432400 [Sorghum bicolor]KAG0542083.1 hypothetical protein BDA96_02G072700 [Sorghum bicolor]OQU88665.1 hypothetical protein SORBI_3002G071201 [Sorghum bicolor]|eukprot:XP_021308409.1 uncharacterized protein LOC110432400 [Sorghum bicolor]